MKKWQKFGLIGLGIFLLLLMVANFGLNFWLKNKLPVYLHKNSDYNVSYKRLDVDLGTGNIFSTDIKIASKNPNNQNVIGLDGTVDTLKVSRFGILDALFRKRISSSDLYLANPKLQITLAKPIDKSGKKRNPVTFENIRIRNGNILILQYTKKKYLSVKDLNLIVENLQMTEKDVENKLPVVFDKYDISGKNFFFRPDNIYALTARQVSTKTGLMNIKNFRLVPLLSYAQFRKYYPKKRNLFSFQSDEMDFQDIVLSGNKIALKNVKFLNPDLVMHTTDKNPQDKQKSFTYDLSLEDIQVKNAKVNVIKDGNKPVFGIERMNMGITKMVMNEETAKGNLPPFNYEKFTIDGRNAQFFTPTQRFLASSMAMDQRSGDFRGIMIAPAAKLPNKTSTALRISRVNFLVSDWSYTNNKLKLDAKSLIVDGANGSITAASQPEPKKNPDYKGFEFPLTLKNVQLKNSNISYIKNGNPITFANLNANIDGIEMNEETVKSGIPFKTGNYSVTSNNLVYRAGKFYNLSAGTLKFNKNSLTVTNFAVKPTVSRSQFVRMIPTEKDLYDIRAAQITVNGEWDMASASKYLNASTVNINGVYANIFRSKVPADDQTVKPMYGELLRKIKFPLFVNVLNIRNSVVEYEEDTPQSEGAGKLTFSNFNMTVRNLNSGKMQGKPTAIPIDIHCAFMKASPMNVKWSINTASMDDAFTITGNIADLPASRLNPFIEPYLKVRATGAIEDLIFNYSGNKNGMHGTLRMKHKDLKIAVLNKQGEKNKLLTTVANIFVKDKTQGSFPESVNASADRDKTKSFFNLLWKTTQDGLTKILIGADLKKIQNTVQGAKETVTDTKSTVKTTKEKVAEKVDNTKEKVQETKTKVKETTEKTKGFFDKIFKKKE